MMISVLVLLTVLKVLLYRMRLLWFGHRCVALVRVLGLRICMSVLVVYSVLTRICDGVLCTLLAPGPKVRFYSVTACLVRPFLKRCEISVHRWLPRVPPIVLIVGRTCGLQLHRCVASLSVCMLPGK